LGRSSKVDRKAAVVLQLSSAGDTADMDVYSPSLVLRVKTPYA